MRIENKQNKRFTKIIKIWHELIEKEYQGLRKQMSELKISSLSACIGDCYTSFHEIYFKSIPALQKALKENNYDQMQNCVIDITFAFDHIYKHIGAAKEGFLHLANQLESKENNSVKSFRKKSKKK